MSRTTSSNRKYKARNWKTLNSSRSFPKSQWHPSLIRKTHPKSCAWAPLFATRTHIRTKFWWFSRLCSSTKISCCSWTSIAIRSFKLFLRKWRQRPKIWVSLIRLSLQESCYRDRSCKALSKRNRAIWMLSPVK